MIALAVFAMNSFAMAAENTTTSDSTITLTQDVKVIDQFIAMMEKQAARMDAAKSYEELEKIATECTKEIADFQTKYGVAIQEAMASLSAEEQALYQAKVVAAAMKYQEVMTKKATEFGMY